MTDDWNEKLQESLLEWEDLFALECLEMPMMKMKMMKKKMKMMKMMKMMMIQQASWQFQEKQIFGFGEGYQEKLKSIGLIGGGFERVFATEMHDERLLAA